MSLSMGALLQLLFAVLGVAQAPDSGLAALAVVAVAAIAVAAIALHMAGLPLLSGRSTAHPRTSIDVSAPLDQSDPDAAGHTRPRAPGLAAQAA